MPRGDMVMVERLGQKRPEVPIACRAAHSGAGVALDGMVEVGELQGVTQEKHRGVVSHQVPVALIGVKLNGETSYVSLGIGGPAFTGYGGKPHKARGLLARFRENRGTGEFRQVVGHGEGAESTRAFGMHSPLGNHLTVEVGYFFKIPRILQSSGATHPCGLNIRGVSDRAPVFSGQSFLIHTITMGVRVKKY